MDKQIQEAIEKQYRESYNRIIAKRRKRKQREALKSTILFYLFLGFMGALLLNSFLYCIK